MGAPLNRLYEGVSLPVSTALTFEDLLLPAAEFSDPAAPEYRLCLVLRGEAELSWQSELFINFSSRAGKWVRERLESFGAGTSGAESCSPRSGKMGPQRGSR